MTPKYSTAKSSRIAVGATVLIPSSTISPSCAPWPLIKRKTIGVMMTATNAVAHFFITTSMKITSVAKPRSVSIRQLSPSRWRWAITASVKPWVSAVPPRSRVRVAASPTAASIAW